ncbi:MAG TPA: response regulator transcription factor [Bacillus sp. (in: firmicutes)]|nr:response regulator transcription factor [Bacillus sp. (in: firmicutes)]
MQIEVDPVWCKKVSEHLRLQPDMVMVGSVSTEEEAIRIIEQKKVDVIITDAVIADSAQYDGLDTIAKITRRKNVFVIVLSSVCNSKVITDSFCVGAINFISKQNYKDLTDSIRDAYYQKIAIHSDAAPILRKEFCKLKLESLERLLTKNERQVLAYLHEGYTKHKISEMMNVGFETTKTHVKHILSKLKVSSSKEAVRVAKRLGMFN